SGITVRGISPPRPVSLDRSRRKGLRAPFRPISRRPPTGSCGAPRPVPPASPEPGPSGSPPRRLLLVQVAKPFGAVLFKERTPPEFVTCTTSVLRPAVTAGGRRSYALRGSGSVGGSWGEGPGAGRGAGLCASGVRQSPRQGPPGPGPR